MTWDNDENAWNYSNSSPSSSTTATPQSSQMKSNGGGWGTGMDWLERFYGMYNAHKKDQRNKPSFIAPPINPEQKQVFDWAMERLKSLPNTTNDLYPTAMAHATANPKFDIDAARAGKSSYTAPDYKSLESVFRSNMGTAQGQNPTQQHVNPGLGNARGGAGGIQDKDMLGGVDTIPQPISPETNPQRNVGIPGNINSSDPTAGQSKYPTYGPGGQGQQMKPGTVDFSNAVNSFSQFMQKEGMKDAGRVAFGFFTGGLTGAALAAAQMLYQKWQSSHNTNTPPPTAPPTTGTP